MAAQLNGQTTWDAKSKADREAAIKALYDAHMLRPDDTVRFPRHHNTTAKIEGKPIGIATDGSITCSAGGRLRAVLPEKLEVKMTGPRGGTTWERLIPEAGT